MCPASTRWMIGLVALQRRDIWVNSSSGTSGKNSFLAMNRQDMDVALPLMIQAAKSRFSQYAGRRTA